MSNAPGGSRVCGNYDQHAQATPAPDDRCYICRGAVFTQFCV